MPSGEFEALVLRHVAEREGQLADRIALRRVHVERRSHEVVSWTAGQACPLGRLAEAWVTYRHGSDVAATTGTAAAGRCSLLLARRAERAVSLYEAFADERPPGWPATGPAALCALASQLGATVLGGDIARLLVLAKAMRARALARSAARVERAAARACRRQNAPTGRVAFRTNAPSWETAEQRRVRVRDRVLLDGADPAAWPNAALAAARGVQRADEPELTGPDPHAELDGIGARPRATATNSPVAAGPSSRPSSHRPTPNRRTAPHEPTPTRRPPSMPDPGPEEAERLRPLRTCSSARL